VKIRMILVMSLVALGSGAAYAEPLFSPMFGEVAPPRPPKLIGRSTSQQRHLPAPRPGRAAAPVKKLEQKPAAPPAPANPDVATIGPSAVLHPVEPTPAGTIVNAPAFRRCKR
jgi:hypothetical protein